MKKTHRFIGSYQLGLGMLRIADSELAHQMRSVLKLAPGESVVLGDGAGLEAVCVIKSYDRDAVVLEGVSVGRNSAELPLRTTLYCAVLKADHFELVAAKATEVGISEIVPIVTARTVKLNLRTDRLERIVREAAELAGRGIVPVVHPVRSLDEALTDASQHDAVFFFDPSGEPFTPAAKSARTAGLFVGPEGGWDDTEIEMIHAAGVRIVSLGSLVFRGETAAIIAAYLVAHSVKK